MKEYFYDRYKQLNFLNNEMCGASKAERAERSGLSRFFFGYFLCSNDKESNNKYLDTLI